MRNTKGFTLIELMIVIAIIAILAAIIIPAIKEINGRTSQIDENGTPVTMAEVKSNTLMCTDAASTVVAQVSIPGQRWAFENGLWVTIDSNGNTIAQSTPNGGKCTIEEM